MTANIQNSEPAIDHHQSAQNSASQLASIDIIPNSPPPRTSSSDTRHRDTALYDARTVAHVSTGDELPTHTTGHPTSDGLHDDNRELTEQEIQAFIRALGPDPLPARPPHHHPLEPPPHTVNSSERTHVATHTAPQGLKESKRTTPHR